MPQHTKHGLSLVAWSAIHGVHVSTLSRMSARNLDITDGRVVREWIKVNGREATRYSRTKMAEVHAVKTPSPAMRSIQRNDTAASRQRTPEEIEAQRQARREFVKGLSAEAKAKIGTELEIEAWIQGV